MSLEEHKIYESPPGTAHSPGREENDEASPNDSSRGSPSTSPSSLSSSCVSSENEESPVAPPVDAIRIHIEADEFVARFHQQHPSPPQSPLYEDDIDRTETTISITPYLPSSPGPPLHSPEIKPFSIENTQQAAMMKSSAVPMLPPSASATSSATPLAGGPPNLPFSRPTHPSVLIPYEGVFYSLPVDDLDISLELNLSTAFVRISGRWKNIAAYTSDVLFVLPIAGTVSSCTVQVGGRTLETIMLPLDEIKKITDEQERIKKEKERIEQEKEHAKHNGFFSRLFGSKSHKPPEPTPAASKQAQADAIAQGQLPPMSFDTYIPNLFRLPISNVASGEMIHINVIYIESAQFRHPTNDTLPTDSASTQNTGSSNNGFSQSHQARMIEESSGYYEFTLPLTFSSTLILPHPITHAPRTITDILRLRAIINSMDGPSRALAQDMQWWSPTHHMLCVDDTFPRCELVMRPIQERIDCTTQIAPPSVMQRQAFMNQASYTEWLASIDWTICYTMTSETILPSVIMEITQQEVVREQAQLTLAPSMPANSPESPIKSKSKQRRTLSASPSPTTPTTPQPPATLAPPVSSISGSPVSSDFARRQEIVQAEEGNFLLFVTPPAVENLDETCSRRMVFLVDRSGSMVGESYSEACRALLVAISELKTTDYFTICVFDHTEEWFSPELLTVSPKSILLATKWLELHQPQGGGTNIYAPLERAMKHLKKLEERDKDREQVTQDGFITPLQHQQQQQGDDGGGAGFRTLSVDGPPSASPSDSPTNSPPQMLKSLKPTQLQPSMVELLKVPSLASQTTILGLTPGGDSFISSTTNSSQMLIPQPTTVLSFIVLLTDGCVANEKEICYYAHRQLAPQEKISKNEPNKLSSPTPSEYDSNPQSNIRICTLGIGSYCNWYFLKMLSQLGRGVNDIIQYREKIYSQVLTLMHHTTSLPVLTNVSLDIDKVWMDDVLIYPYPIPDLYMGAPLTLSAKYKGRLPDQLTLIGRHADGSQYRSVITPRISHVIPVVKVFLKQRLDCLTARAWLEADVSQESLESQKRLREEIIELSCQHNFSSAYTGMVLYETPPNASNPFPAPTPAPSASPSSSPGPSPAVSSSPTPFASSVQAEMDLAQKRAKQAFLTSAPNKNAQWYRDPKKLVGLAGASAVVIGTAAFSFGSLGGTADNFPGFGGDFHFDSACCHSCGDGCHHCECGASCCFQ